MTVSRKTSTALYAALAVLATPAAFAQTPPTNVDHDGADKTAPAKTDRDTVVIVGGLEQASPIDTLGAASVVSRDTMDRRGDSTAGSLFASTPGVSASGAGDDTSTVANIRGLQDNGRILVLVDGARQEFSRPTHAGYGSFYLDPDLLRSVSVLRGPSATGGGNIGGVINFETLNPADLLKGDEWQAFQQKFGYETNGDGFTSSSTGAFEIGPVGVLGNVVLRRNGDYEDGAGQRIRISGQRPRSGLLKVVVGENRSNQLTLGATVYTNDYLASRQAGSPSTTLSVDASDAFNSSFTARWTFNPGGDWIDFVGNAYSTTTDVDQRKVGGAANTLGQTRGYDVTTNGVNAFNSSHFDAMGMQNVLTVGADLSNTEAKAYGDTSAARGELDNTGAFVELHSTYANWLQVIGSLRYNSYELTGRTAAGVEVKPSDEKITPRLTIGVTPLDWATVYATYSEGFRPPAIYEVFGIYAGGSATNPSLDLKPEEARSYEVGANIKAGTILGGDTTLKLNGFDTRIDNYITGRNILGSTRFYNIEQGRLRGFEFEGAYDAAWGFASLSGALIDAEREGNPIPGTTPTAPQIPVDGVTLSTAPLTRVSASLGLNAFDKRLSYGVMYTWIDETERNTIAFPTAPISPSYELLNLFSSYAVTDDVILRFNVDNVFDEAYSDPQAQYATGGPTSFQGRGRTFKISLTTRFGAN